MLEKTLEAVGLLAGASLLVVVCGVFVTLLWGRAQDLWLRRRDSQLAKDLLGTVRVALRATSGQHPEAHLVLDYIEDAIIRSLNDRVAYNEANKLADLLIRLEVRREREEADRDR